MDKYLIWDDAALGPRYLAPYTFIVRSLRGHTLPVTHATGLRLADVLNISLDELAGREPIKEDEQIHNHELHQLVRQVDQLSDDDQRALIAVMDGLVKRTQIGKMARTAASTPKARGPRRSNASTR